MNEAQGDVIIRKVIELTKDVVALQALVQLLVRNLPDSQALIEKLDQGALSLGAVGGEEVCASMRTVLGTNTKGL